MGPSILIDDSRLVTNYNYLGTQWTHQTGDNSVLNGTLTVCNPASQSQNVVPTNPSLTISFWGSGISFYGNMTNNVAANYTIDQTTLRPVPFPSGISNGKTGINLFSLLNITEGLSHTINIFPTAGQFVLDYVTYVPNIDTTLTAADLILDDADPEIQYGNANWNHTTGDFQQGRPYNGTMTGTNTKGATMQLTFVGSSVTVYGLLNRVDGRLSASFTVDGQNSSASTFNPFDGEQEDTDSSRWMLSQQFFRQDLSPGQHTLKMTLVDISGPQMLWIDSVMFEGTSATKLTFPSGSGSDSGSDGVLTPGQSSSSGLSKAAIGGIAAAAFFLAIAFFSYAKRKWSGASNRKPVGYTAYVPPPPPPPGPPQVTIYNNAHMHNPYDAYNPANQYNYNHAPTFLPALVPSPPVAPPHQPHEYHDWSAPPTATLDGAVPAPPPKQPPAIPTADLVGSDGSSSSYASPSSASASATRPPLRTAALDGSATGTSLSTNDRDPRAESYYTYSSKADLIGLEWGVRPEAGPESSVAMGDGAAAVKMPIPATGPVVSAQGKNSMDKARYSNLGGGKAMPTPAVHGDGAMRLHTTNADAAQRGDGTAPAPSNHGLEDGRDADEEEQAMPEPRRERDAGPADFPPAYDDRLYGQ
ncbi:hypothetical protein BDN70DRAFT_995911 [Pholiota conissans]|uniref:Uncharacterized protein n=1 Tax=Pholiota conissans TaxID=109636 RepID=A0A9P5YWR3_9AGAR|nr:hypothetical protein BDN70DRAFT_995911 [Pholiota conissans]